MPSRFKRPRSVSPPEIQRKRQISDHLYTDDIHDSASLSDSSDQIRILSWNVNGIEPLIQKRITFGPPETYPLRNVLERYNWPQFFCLQEVKIGLTDSATQRKLEQAANYGSLLEEPTYTTCFSLPRDKYNAIGFGGKVHGVATLVRDDFMSKIKMTRKPDWDLEGRVLIHETIGKIAVINGYWVNGTSNPYRDPCTGQITGTRHDHKLRFHKNMLEETLSLEKKGFRVILIGDMNVARADIDGFPNLRISPIQHVKNRADFNKKFFLDEEGMKGVDIFRHLHGNERRYTYYPRNRSWGSSCDRVDLIIASKTLIENPKILITTGICNAEADRGHSDHVPLWVSINQSATITNPR